MRPLVALALALLAGCGAPPTGLVITLDYNDDDIVMLKVHGTSATERAFGPYGLTAMQAPSGSTVGLVLDATDEGRAKVCTEGRDQSGTVLASACDELEVRAGTITRGTLSLTAPRGAN